MNFKKVKPGEVLSSTMYNTVVRVTPNGLWVRDTNGLEFEIKGPKFIEQTMNSDSQFSKEDKITATALAEKLITAGDSVFTVEFVKADGTDRTLTGYLLGTENHMGRSNVVDLRHTGPGSSQRQVDHRTIKSLILRGTKYLVKK